eukprot:TRINITY_DN979_c0_g1_i1.p1 TRINITY_DN979_c0_g1~~TRINITY_DN979_c0_g1_i1.p1  ORF type:complete len:324 (+),score=13.94 TRINITY_DN979_c0_g1_i1:106-1077(+)
MSFHPIRFSLDYIPSQQTHTIPFIARNKKKQLIRTETETFVNQRGQRLRYRKFIPNGEMKAVLVVHLGYREHLDRKNQPLGIICSEGGYLIFLLEAHGHGLSEPVAPKYLRFTTQDIFYYVDDYTQFISEIVEQNDLVKERQLQTFIGGTSMGGQIAVMTAIREKSRFQGLVLGCPAIDVEWNWTMLLQKRIAGVLTRFFPYNRIVPAVPMDQVTLEPDVAEDIMNDKLMIYGPVAVIQAWQMLQGFEYIAEHEHELMLPILVTLGTEDKTASFKAIKRFLNNSQSTDVTLDLIEGGFHAIDIGKHMRKFCNSQISWLNQHLQ